MMDNYSLTDTYTHFGVQFEAVHLWKHQAMVSQILQYYNMIRTRSRKGIITTYCMTDNTIDIMS